MAELKRTFTGGKMEKDLDERIVPSGQYREALNIGVATSEDSDVGAAQNILGNIKVTEAIQSRKWSSTTGPDNAYTKEGPNNNESANHHVAQIVDPETDMLYRFIYTASIKEGVWMGRIVEFNTQTSLGTPWQEKEKAVMVDIFKVTSHIVKEDDYDPICEGSNKSIIKVDKNTNQLRWGMRVGVDDGDDDITIENIDYISGAITLNKQLFTGDVRLFPIEVNFYGDRNLSFGNVNNIKKITGINIVDGMIFWTDNFSEPKKINIERGKDGCDTTKWANAVPGRFTTPATNPSFDDFNQHTLLIISEENPQECAVNDASCIIEGCTDPLATNYDASATANDGSCIYPPPPPIYVTYDCDLTLGTGCVGRLDGSGFYPTLAACNAACVPAPSTYYCTPWDGCVACGWSVAFACPGTYPTFADCSAACGNNPVSDPTDPTGQLGDSNNDGVVDNADLAYVNTNWLQSGDVYDSNDGIVNLTDLSLVLDNFGQGQSITTPITSIIQPSWNCYSGNCSDPGTGLGTYTTLNACNSSCSTTSSAGSGTYTI